jgi:hypothetical protein
MPATVNESVEVRPEIGVYAPRPNTIAWLTIPPGSAMVVDPPPGATANTQVTCYFETWERHDPSDTPFANLVNIAAGRCHWRKSSEGEWTSYPTQSKAPLQLGDLVLIGVYDDHLGEVRLDPAHESLLRRWRGNVSDLASDLRASGRGYDEARSASDPKIAQSEC